MDSYLIKTVERTVAAYVATFLGFLVANGIDLTSAATYRDAAVDALPSLFMAILSLLAPLVGDSKSPAFLPKASEGRQE